MAPEVIKEQRAAHGWKKADVWCGAASVRVGVCDFCGLCAGRSVGCTVIEMVTGRPPWSQFSNPVTAMYHIACVESMPAIPETLSPSGDPCHCGPRLFLKLTARAGKDFLTRCFQRDPAKRPDVTSLLLHPFVSALPSMAGPYSSAYAVA